MAELFEIAVIVFEAVAVAVLIFGTLFCLGSSIRQLFQGSKPHQAYRKFRHGFGRTLLLALDLLVAADIVLTVTLDLSFETLGMLGLLVLIRTFLHFVLELEVTGRWPWQAAHGAADDPEE
jgi:uncharacterized membrane protein